MEKRGFVRTGSENLMLEWKNPDFPDYLRWEIPHLWLIDPWPVEAVFNMALGEEITMEILTDDTRTTPVESTELNWSPIHQGVSSHTTSEPVGMLSGYVSGREEFFRL